MDLGSHLPQLCQNAASLGCDDAAGGCGQLRGCGAGVETLWTTKSAPRARRAGMRGPLRRMRGQQRPHDNFSRQRLSPRRIRVTICGRVHTASMCNADRIGAQRVAPSPNFPLHNFSAGQFIPTRPCTPHRLAKGSDLAAPGFCVRRHKPPQPSAQPAPPPTAFTDGAHGYPEAISNHCSACFPQVRPSARGY